MDQEFSFTDGELQETLRLFDEIKQKLSSSLLPDDEGKVRGFVKRLVSGNKIRRDVFGLNPVLNALRTAVISIDEIGLKRDGVIAALLYLNVSSGNATIEETGKSFGENVARIIHGLKRINALYQKNPVIESENFRNLLLSFAEDMRVILIMIADRVNLMRQIRDTKNVEAKKQVSQEASYLYAPLAHKLGLYALKSELEDLSLKYLEHDAYYMIRDNLNATKKSRDAYVERFVAPIQEKLDNAGFKYRMKGRTKSIHSIWQKMKRQQCSFEKIYDLFAIRIILDAPMEQEKMQCWQVYSYITDMYQPNPKRLRDWLSVPKSNGYESLHITVLGPGNKWVEVQIRTERMDDIAEHGLAAHWRYKGIHQESENSVEDWLAGIRNALEAGTGLQVMDQFRMDLYEDEVFVFTPKGEIKKFPKGATVLDFAYRIHSNVGNTCVGAKINGKNVPIREKLKSGDMIEIITQNSQKPSPSWLEFVKTSRAKSKIRSELKQEQQKETVYAKELLERRFKNKKVALDENFLSQLVRKMGYKEVTEFYEQIALEALDVNDVIDQYAELKNSLQNTNNQKPAESARNFQFYNPNGEIGKNNEDVLVVDKDLKGIDYTLAKCCQPIYGDRIFGFVTISGGIKIHRMDCPNAPEMRRRFGYRIVKARWSGKGTSKYSITLRVIGNDDIGILNNITSIISHEEKVAIRSVHVDSQDRLFRGNIVVMLEDVSKLTDLINKLKDIKGVLQVNRI